MKNIKMNQVRTKEGSAKIRCNNSHSGNHSLVFDHGFFQCQGCGAFYTVESVVKSLMGPVEEFTGGGGVFRRK